MSVEALGAPRMVTPREAVERSKLLVDKVVSKVKENTRLRRASPEITVPTSFDLQFDAKRLLVTPEFPNGIEYSFAKPDQPTDKPLVVVACGVQEPPGNIKAFMGLLVDNGWPILSIYDFKHRKGLLPDDQYPSVIKQQALANKLVLEEVMQAEDIDQFHAFGHSKGGLVAALLAASNSEQCISYLGYAPAGMTGEITVQDLVTIAMRRTKEEILFNIRETIKHPMQTFRNTRGAAKMKLYSMLPLLRELGIKTNGIFGDEDPIVFNDRLVLLSEDGENSQFDEMVTLHGNRHSELVERPKNFIHTVIRLLSQAERHKMMSAPIPEGTVIYAAA